MIEVQKTQKGTSYWADDSVNSEKMSKLWDELVPSKGEADTVHGELVRAFGRLNYEFGNNGNCNAIEWEEETCPSCDGLGYEEEECSTCDGDGYYYDDNNERVDCEDCDNGFIYDQDCYECDGNCTIPTEPVITDMYDDFLDFLSKHLLDSSPVRQLRMFLVDPNKGYSKYTFNEDEMKVYNDLGDEVMRTIANTENKKRIVLEEQD